MGRQYLGRCLTYHEDRPADRAKVLEPVDHLAEVSATRDSG